MERRIDPIDGVAYTWEELRQFYIGSYSEKGIVAWWAQCQVAKGIWRCKRDHALPQSEEHPGWQPQTNARSARKWRCRFPCENNDDKDIVSEEQKAMSFDPKVPSRVESVGPTKCPELLEGVVPVLPAGVEDFVDTKVADLSQCLSFLRDPNLCVVPARSLNLARVSHLTRKELTNIFNAAERATYRRWGGRAMLDFKIRASPFFRLKEPYWFLNPLVGVLVALAHRSLGVGENLALIQLLLNYYPGASDRVRPHRHPCRQVCASLGSSRDVDVDGIRIRMKHGDCLPLDGEMHAVPPAEDDCGPRLSICLFYASVEQCTSGEARVLSNGSFWWSHPEDERESNNFAA